MSKRDLKKLSQEEKDADAALNRYADEHGILKCVGFRKGVFTYLDMSVSMGKFRLATEPDAPFDKTASDVKSKYSTTSHRASVSIRVVTHLQEADHFSKPAFEHHWTLEEWFRTYWEEWQAIQVKWPRPSPEKVRREARKDQKQEKEQQIKRAKVRADEIDQLVVKLRELEISNRELLAANSEYANELKTLRQHKQSIEVLDTQLVHKERELAEKERHLAYWWAQKTEYERQQNKRAMELDMERRQKERLEKHAALETQRETEKTAYIKFKAHEDARLMSAYKGLSWREVLIGLNMYESHNEERAQAKKRITKLLHPDGFNTRHKSMEARARAEAQFVFLNNIMG